MVTYVDMRVMGDGWKPVKAENPDFKCRFCQSDDLHYRVVESSCGAYDDTNYWCKACGKDWWVESSDY